MKIIVFFLLILSNLSSLFSSDIDINLNTLRNNVITSLTLNYYHIYKDKCLPYTFYNFAILDSNCLYNIEYKKLDTVIKTKYREYELYSYSFDFTYNCSQNNWENDSGNLEIINKLENQYKEVTISQLINKLHMNGLFGIDKKTNSTISISGTSIDFTLESLLLKNLNKNSINKLISLKYYSYSPNDIRIDLEKYEFSFFSEILNRRYFGKIVFQETQNYYKLVLENGILINK